MCSICDSRAGVAVSATLTTNLSADFGYLPIGDIAYRVNLLSVASDSLAFVMVYFIIMRLVDDLIAAV